MGTPRGEPAARAVVRGTYDAENRILSLDFPERGGTYDFRRDGDSRAFYPRSRSPARYVYRPPPARDEGWPTRTLAEAGIDRAAIERAVQRQLEAPMDSAATRRIHALLIARHGRRVLEEYFHGENREHLHETRLGEERAGPASGPRR